MMVSVRLMPFAGGTVSSKDPSTMALLGLQATFVQTSKVSVTKPSPDAAGLLDRAKSVILAAPPTTDTRNPNRASREAPGALMLNPGLNLTPNGPPGTGS